MYSPANTPLLVGVFSTASAVQAAFPAAAFPGSLALVGAAAPYLIYWSDGNTWNNYGTSALATAAQGALAATSLQPGGAFTQASIDGSTAAGVSLFTAATAAQQKLLLGLTSGDITDAGTFGKSLLQAGTPNAALNTLGSSYALTFTTYVLGQPVNGTTFGSVGTTTKATLALPSWITANGGYIYVDGAGAGGGGSGGSTDTGGGGGGGARACCMLPVYVPAGNASIYIQVGGGGLGSAGNSAGNSAVGVSGSDTYIKIGGDAGAYILRLVYGLGGGVATATGAGGAGGTNAHYIYSGGSGGAGSGNGSSGSPVASSSAAADTVVAGRFFTGGAGGGGAGNAATIAGASGWSLGIWGQQASGAGAGGAGGSSPWGISGTNTPVMAPVGTGGNGGAGGASPTAGTTCIAFGGGGGGGGKGMAGGKGGDGFLRIGF